MTNPRLVGRPTHNLTLTDGTNTLGLILTNPRGEPDPCAIREVPMPKTVLQTSSGDPTYGNYALPYTPFTQKDFSGGRGEKEFRKDSTRYFDSGSDTDVNNAVDTTHGDVILSGRKTFAYGYSYNMGYLNPTMNQTISVGGGVGTAAYAVRYIAEGTRTVRSIRVRLRVFANAPGGEGEGAIAAAIHSEAGGLPDAQLAASAHGFKVVAPDVPEFTEYTFPIQCPVTLGTAYWVVIWITSTFLMGMEYQIDNTQVTISRAKFVSGAWMADGTGAPYMVLSTAFNAISFPFEYQGLMYAARMSEEGSGVQLVMNGMRGFAKDNSTDHTVLKTDLNLVGWNLTGCKIKLIAGPGCEEETNWRTILTNTQQANNNTITVTPDWKINHTAATEFVVKGMNLITSISGHDLVRVTDVLVVDDIIYFCEGENHTVRRGRYSGGAWSWAWEGGTNNTDGTKASFMELITDSAGKRKIWRALANTSQAYSADVVAWGVNLTWSAAVNCDNPRYKITNLVAYGTPQLPWIIKENMFGSIGASTATSPGVFAPVPLAELASVSSELNGRAATTFGIYLFFNVLYGWERFYDNRLDDLGPDRDEGLPSGRNGPIVDAIPYPGGIIVAINGGTTGKSSVLYWNQIGWHELARTEINRSITALHLEVMPGSQIARLWIFEPQDIYWIPITVNPLKQSEYTYCDSGTLITGWYQAQFGEVTKFWKSLTIHSEFLSATHQTITAYYQTDAMEGAGTWTALPTVFTESPSQTVLIANDYSVASKRIRFKLVLATDDSTKTPRVKALTIDAVTRIPPATAWSVTFQAAAFMQNRQGRWEAVNEEDVLAQLREWSDSSTHAAPLLMRSEDPAWDNRRVFIDPASINPDRITSEANSSVRTRKLLTMNIIEA